VLYAADAGSIVPVDGKVKTQVPAYGPWLITFQKTYACHAETPSAPAGLPYVLYAN